MANYSIAQLIGKSMYAKEKLPLYKTTSSAKPYGYVMSGGFIGVLDSWINKEGKIWFVFKSNAGQYVVPYIAYSFEPKALKEQGAKTDEQLLREAQEKADRENSPIEYYLKKYGIWVVVAVIAGKALQGGFQGYLSKSK